MLATARAKSKKLFMVWAGTGWAAIAIEHQRLANYWLCQAGLWLKAISCRGLVNILSPYLVSAVNFSSVHRLVRALD